MVAADDEGGDLGQGGAGLTGERQQGRPLQGRGRQLGNRRLDVGPGAGGLEDAQDGQDLVVVLGRRRRPGLPVAGVQDSH